MDNFNQVLKISHDWAMSRIHGLSETFDVECVKDAIIDAAASHDQIINKLNDDENLD